MAVLDVVSLADSLRAAGIELRHFDLGTRRASCPACARVKYRPRDDALSVTIEPGGAVWFCHRCQWSGNTAGAQRAARAELIVLAEARKFIEGKRHATRAEQARSIWHDAAPAAAEHPYLLRKRLPGVGLRQAARFQSLRDSLLVPMRDADGYITNLQGIDPVGEKRFLAGAQTRGAFACVGPWVGGSAPELLAVGEGWATTQAFILTRGAFRGVAAMSAHNLPTIAKLMRDLFPAAKISILADQDSVGVRAATHAQIAAQADFVAPGFRHAGVKDFSDLWIQQCRETKTV